MGPEFAAALFAWAMGLAWERVAVEYQMAEGDLSMLVLRNAPPTICATWAACGRSFPAPPPPRSRPCS